MSAQNVFQDGRRQMMSKCQQWISAWMSMMFLLIVSVTGVGSVEAHPAVAQVSYPAQLKEQTSLSAPKMPYQLDPYLFYQKGVDVAELDRENQLIAQEKQEVRRLALQREEEQRIRIESRGMEMAEFARFQKLRLGQRVAASAENFIGTQYVWGGTNPNQGFDCSGFTQYVLSTNGIKVPRNSYDQFAVGE
jgi:cell wall-associated NlpC family hydrolase